MFALSVLEAPNTKINSLCEQTHLAIKLFLISAQCLLFLTGWREYLYISVYRPFSWVTDELWYILTIDLPVSINLWGCQGRGDSTHYGSQNPWHSMQVMNATSVLNLQFRFQNRLKEHKTVMYKTVLIYLQLCVREMCTTDRKVFVSQYWNSSSEESHDHRAKRSQHHLSSCSHSNTTSQCSILDVHLKDRGM